MKTKTKIRILLYACLGIVALLLIRNVANLRHPTMGEDLLDDLKRAKALDVTFFDDGGGTVAQRHISDAEQVKRITDILDRRLFEYKNIAPDPKELKIIAVLKFDTAPFFLSVYENGQACYSFTPMDQYFVADMPKLKKACLDIVNQQAKQPKKPLSASNDVNASILNTTLFGFIDGKGRIAIPPVFPQAKDFSEGMAAVKTAAEGKWGFIDKRGSLQMPCVFSSVGDFSEGYACCECYNIFVVYLDKNGHAMPISGEFDSGEDFHEGLAMVGFLSPKNVEYIRHLPPGTLTSVSMGTGEKAYIDKNGKIVVRGITNGGSFHDGLACVQKLKGNGRYGFIDKSGRFVIKPKFLLAQDFSEGFVCVSLDGRNWTYINSDGVEAVPVPAIVIACPFVDGVAWIRTRGEDGKTIDVLINKKGETIFTQKQGIRSGGRIQTLHHTMFSEGLCGIGILPETGNGTANNAKSADSPRQQTVGCLWGYIDTSGKIVVPPRFEEVHPSSEGLLRVKSNGKYGFLDHKGHWVIPPVFDACYDFHDGLARFSSPYDEKAGLERILRKTR